MSVLGIVIKWILGLGAAIFVPIIIIIAGLIVGMKIKDAIFSWYHIRCSLHWYVNADRIYV